MDVCIHCDVRLPERGKQRRGEQSGTHLMLHQAFAQLCELHHRRRGYFSGHHLFVCKQWRTLGTILSQHRRVSEFKVLASWC